MKYFLHYTAQVLFWLPQPPGLPLEKERDAQRNSFLLRLFRNVKLIMGESQNYNARHLNCRILFNFYESFSIFKNAHTAIKFIKAICIFSKCAITVIKV